ncbi:Dynamin-related protein 3A [Platanthera guangdongensis]|uniref:Dynamin-related protein 3A n=1 Tax=Platanthera guangdongensis TaxID=2320717 RepID=A0ABR2LH37_9ASPA
MREGLRLAFTSIIEGKKEELSTAELSGGARIHYIFQSIFVKSLEEVDPCADVTDEDIRMAIQNATDPKSALFVLELIVPFEVLVRRQIGRLLDPSLQCAKFIYDELIKMSHHSLANELHRYPVMRKRMDEVIRNFLRDGISTPTFPHAFCSKLLELRPVARNRSVTVSPVASFAFPVIPSRPPPPPPPAASAIEGRRRFLIEERRNGHLAVCAVGRSNDPALLTIGTKGAGKRSRSSCTAPPPLFLFQSPPESEEKEKKGFSFRRCRDPSLRRSSEPRFALAAPGVFYREKGRSL